MRTELLLLVPDDETFCSSKKAFVDFLKVDELISVSGAKISFRRTPKAKEAVTAKFRVETDKVKSKQERYFLLTLDCQDEGQIDGFSELCERIRTIGERLSPGKTSINVIWDDVGRIYAEKSYPIINEVENLLRRLIAKFMLITVGVNWSRDAIHPDLFKKIESFDDPEPHVNDLFKLDFIHLNQVLFEKKRDISLEELDRLLSKTAFNDDDKEKILRYLPRSNWDKYFSSLMEEKESHLEKKWAILYKFRNKVAHNRHVKRDEYEQLKGLASQIKTIIKNASERLGEIDINEEDRELIVFSYTSESPSSIAYATEKAVAEHYMRAGYEVSQLQLGARSPIDFVATKGDVRLAVIVKSVSARHFRPMLRITIDRNIRFPIKDVEGGAYTKTQLVVVIRDEDANYPLSKITSYATGIQELIGPAVEIQIGRLTDGGVYESV